MPNPLAPASRYPSLARFGAFAPKLELWLSKLAEADLSVVRRLTAAERSKVLRFFAIVISKLGNGWNLSDPRRCRLRAMGL